MPKIVDHEERRAHIVDAAMRVIMDRGYERLTMREIAAAAGYAHGAIVRYFPDKRSLLNAAFVASYELTDRLIVASLADARGLEALRLMCGHILPFGESGHRHARIVLAFWGHALQDEEVLALHRVNNERWRDLMRRCLRDAREDGELDRRVDIDAAVAEVAARNAGWQMTAALLPDHARDAILSKALADLIDGFRSETP